MRLIVMFDLPMNSKEEVRVYNRFRKWLTENGYTMIQFSIYVKMFNNRDSCAKHTQMLRRQVPSNGQVRMMMVTEKQYSSIEIIAGGVSNQEQYANVDPLVIL